MNLDASCNLSSCSSQITDKHQGICPPNWHIPNNAEWDVLVNYAGGADKYSLSADNLKATSDWNLYGNGTDAYGFAALPGGIADSDGSFDAVGYIGAWWSASEDYVNIANLWAMNYINERVVSGGYYYKNTLLSVRCVKD